MLATEETLKRWFGKEVICNVEIWNEEDDVKLVIVANLNSRSPLSSTNNFKKIASAIKEKHLADIADDKILWSEAFYWDGAMFPTLKEITI